MSDQNIGLKKLNIFLNAIIDNIPDMIFIKEAKTLKFVKLNKAAEALLGLKVDDMLGKNDYDFFPKKQADFFIKNDRDVLSSKALKDIPVEEIFSQALGKIYLHTKKIPLYNEKGEPVYLLGISENITEKINHNKEIIALNSKLEKKVVQRTLELSKKNAKLSKEIAERAEIQNKLNNSLLELKLLYEAQQIANEIHHFNESLHRLILLICSLTGWPAGHAYVLNETENVLQPSGIWYINQEEHVQSFKEMTEQIVIYKGVGLAGRIWQSGQSEWAKNIQKKADYLCKNTCSSLKIRSALGFPIIANGNVIAVCEFFLNQRKDEDPELLQLFQTLGSQLGIAIERQIAQEDLATSEAWNRLLLQSSGEGIFGVDTNGITTFVNQAAAKILGYRVDEMLGPPMHQLIHHSYPDGKPYPTEKSLIYKAFRDGQFHRETGEVLWRKDGVPVPVEYVSSPVYRNEDLMGAVVVFTDITERKKIEQQLERLAHYDPVTSLPNRSFFYEKMNHFIHTSMVDQKEFALLYLDLDDFKKINDSLGHHIGDKLLEYAAIRIQEASRKIDFVARLGGDEFVIIEKEIAGLQDATNLAQRIVQAFQAPFYIDNHELNSFVTIGIALYPNNGADASSLMKSADLAMYNAKKVGKNTYKFFSDELNEAHKRQMVIESHLRHAIEKNEFSIVYQPQYSLLTGTIYGFEAMIRWDTPGLGNVSPEEFIPVAEDMGMIHEIGKWVLETAMRQFQVWANQNPLFRIKSLVLSINLSVLQLIHGDIALTLLKLINRLQFKTDQLLLEVTETSIMNNLDASIQALQAIHQLGIKIAIDDFGTGYSSLNYLKQLPFTALKIDKSFVQDVIKETNTASIVKAMIQLGFSLGLIIVAEGIEEEQQLQFLKDAGCHYGQGYYLCGPIPPDDLIKLICEG